MTFAAPAMLWSLLALAPLVAVYFLKVRPRRRPATAFFLWEKIFHERRSNRLWHRLRSLMSLLIMAAAFAAIALALADPRWTNNERQDLLILIDNSASMQAEESGGTRLELAKEKARDLARALDGVQRAAVATVADRLRYASHLTDNPRELLAAIDKIEPTYERFNVSALPGGQADEGLIAEGAEDAEQPGDAESDADDEAGPGDEAGESEASKEDESPDKGVEEEPEAKEPTDDADAAPTQRVLLVTDGVLSGEETPEGIELVVVGESQTNLGLVAVDLQFVPGSADRMSFYYQLASTAEKAIDVDLLLSRVDDAGATQLAKVIPLVVEPGVNKPQTLTVEGAQPGRWIAELDGDALADDALAADNKAWMIARRPPPIAISVASDDRYFFEQSVQAFTIGSAALRLVADYGEADVVLAKGATDAGRTIIFHPAGESPWWEGEVSVDETEELEVGAVRVAMEGHPLLKHLDPMSISFLGARKVTPPSGSQVLVESAAGDALIYIANRSGESAVVVNLDPVAAEFYFSAWFPVLVHSSAKHLAGREEPLLAVYRPGDTAKLPADAEGFIGKLRGPSDSDDEDAAAELTEPRIRRFDEPGFYEVTSGEKSWSVACSLLAEQESLVSAERDAPEPAALASGSPPAGWFIVLALLAATAESVLYHLRKVG